MAWGEFTISKEGRERLAGVLRALLITQLLLSLSVLIFCYNVSVKVMLLLATIHRVTVFLLYGLILMQVYALKLHYTSGLRLIALMLKCPYWPRLNTFKTRWMICGSLLPANNWLVYAACRATLKALTNELSESLRNGISQYLLEPFWKKFMDTMQIELSCCGAQLPSDWHEIPWINMDFLNEQSDLVLRLAGSDGKILPPVSPYSCCTPRVLTSCYHDPLQQAEWRSLWSLGGASLHARGCVDAVRAPLARALLALHCFCMINVILQVIILILCQLVGSSGRDAALRGMCAGAGRAHIVGTCTVAHTGLPPHETMPSTSAVECVNESNAYAMSLHRRKRRRKLPKHNSLPYLP